MKHIIYKTTNLLNGKFYIGYHSTDNIDDNYLGSGKILKQAIKKYGKDNFKKEILYLFPSKEEALLKEAEIVNQDFIMDDNNYNVKLGGEGGWDHINSLIKTDPEFKEKVYKNVSETLKNLHKIGILNVKGKNSPTYGKPSWNKGLKSDEATRKKISENNGWKMSEEEINERINDLDKFDKVRGYNSILSKKWGISHTQVRRFINKIKDRKKEIED